RVGTLVAQDDKLSYILLPGADKFRVSQFETDTDPFGGNVLVEGGAELLFPLPFIKDQRSVRTAFFIDFGNVFDTDCGSSQLNCTKIDAGELRYSFGVGLSWITGFGPLTFSYAKPFNDSEEDETEAFQFSLGRSF
ncbi:MAG: outer membrane protein insertion porin family, partial [Oceanicoccus sp.]